MQEDFMKLIKALFAVIVVLVIGNVTVANRSVDESLVVSDLSAEIAALQNENTILKSSVATAGSIGTLSAKIEEAGFISTPKIAAVETGSSVASR
jgi:hypothetical protein